MTDALPSLAKIDDGEPLPSCGESPLTPPTRAGLAKQGSGLSGLLPARPGGPFSLLAIHSVERQ